MTKLWICDGEIVLDYPSGPDVNTMILVWGNERCLGGQSGVMKEARIEVMNFEDEGRGHKTRNTAFMQQLEAEKSKETDSFLSL